MLRKFLLWINIISCLCIIIITFKIIVMPKIAVLIWKEDYKEMVFLCDNVMRDHLIAKNKVIVDANKKSVEQLKAAELGLISCHEYDKLRKKLILWGVTEDRLALLGLSSIEENAKNIRRFVEIHEFRY